MAYFEKTAAKLHECERCKGMIPRGAVYIARMDYGKTKKADGTVVTLRRNEHYCITCYKSMETSAILETGKRKNWVQVAKNPRAKRARRPGEPLLVGHCVHGLGRMQD